METVVDKFGRIVIPKKIREDFNLKAGTPIRIEESEKAIILTPVHGEPSLHFKEGVTDKNIVCLLIHDSFIVIKSNENELVKAMKNAYKEVVGYNPLIDKKY